MLVIARRVVALFLLTAGGMMACAHSSQPGASDPKAKPATSANSNPSAPSDDKPAPATMPPQDRVPGEYLVSVQKGGDNALIRNVFATYSVRDVQPVSDNLFLLKIDQDPGPDEIKRKAGESDRIRAVQPNYVYRLERSPGKIDGSVK